MADIRDNTGRARLVRLVFLLKIISSLALVGLGLLGVQQADWLAAQDGAGLGPTALLFLGFALLALLNLGLGVLGLIALIFWLRRAYYNLHQLPGQVVLSYSDGWAAGAWFVPFLNLSRPYTIMREVWEGTQRAARGEATEPNTLLTRWWTLYLVNLIGGRLLDRLTNEQTESVTLADVYLICLSAVLGAGSAWLTRLVVTHVAAFEEQWALRRQVDQLGRPAPPNPLDAEQNYLLDSAY